MSKIKKNSSVQTNSRGITRRQFLKNAGLSSVGVTVVSSGLLGKVHAATDIPSAGKVMGPGTIKLTLTVNGQKLSANVEPKMTLAEVLRNDLNLPGTKIGCDRGACGACTVIMDGRAVTSCMTLAVDAIDKPVETIEGLARSKDDLNPLQRSFIEHDALQCGFCTSGMIMSCKHLLDKNPHPSEEEIRIATSGNLCRCGAYPKIFQAVEALSNSAG